MEESAMDVSVEREEVEIDSKQEQEAQIQISLSLPKNLVNLIEEISSTYCEGLNISQEEFIKGLILHGIGVVNSIILQERQANLQLREQARQSILSVFKTNEPEKEMNSEE